jgi:hypothetical protein
MRTWLEPLLTLLVGAIVALYVNLLTTELTGPNKPTIVAAASSLGWWNLLAIAILGALVAQAYIARRPVLKLRDLRELLIEKLMELICKTMIFPARSHIRAIVTLREGSSGRRATRYSYNCTADPERVASYPLEFGVTGEAFSKKSVVLQELPEGHHALYDSQTKAAVLPEIRTIMAAPILKFKKETDSPLGVLALDSILPAKKLHFDRAEARQLAQGLADIIGIIITECED